MAFDQARSTREKASRIQALERGSPGRVKELAREWRGRHAEQQRARMREWATSEEGRRYHREYARKKYWTDPDYRQHMIDLAGERKRARYATGLRSSPGKTACAGYAARSSPEIFTSITSYRAR